MLCMDHLGTDEVEMRADIRLSFRCIFPGRWLEGLFATVEKVLDHFGRGLRRQVILATHLRDDAQQEAFTPPQRG
jgi:hypothetical protein